MGRVMEELLLERSKEFARSLLTSGKLSKEEIAKYAKVSIEEVNELAKEKDSKFSKVGYSDE